MNKFGIVGHGFVGKAQARAWMEHGDVLIHDIIPELSPNTIEEVAQCDFIFVCVPTPPLDREHGDWSVDLSYVLDVLKQLSDIGTDKTVVIKTTVPVGATRTLSQHFPNLSIVHSPEFLTARCSLIDAQTPARNIVGYPGEEPGLDALKLQVVLENRFPGVASFLMKSDESELVKLACNGFFAAKVTWFNEICALTKRCDLDWFAVHSAMLADGRIAHAHTNVPGPDGKTGYGGTCLPKDLQNLIHCMEDKGSPKILAEAAWHANKCFRKAEYFLENTYGLDENGERNALIHIVLLEFDELMQNDEFETIDEILTTIDISRVSVDYMLVILKSTSIMMSELKERAKFYDDVEAEIRKRGEYEDGLLDGLK